MGMRKWREKLQIVGIREKKRLARIETHQEQGSKETVSSSSSVWQRQSLWM